MAVIGRSYSVFAAALAVTAAARAADPENCLLCHQYRGLARIDSDGRTVHLYQVDPDYYVEGLGPHARLRCTDCHPRDEVGVIPHLPVSPVDCTRQCHLSAENRPEVLFAHDRVGSMLADSVHVPAVMERSNRLLGEPLRAGQSHCLLCHDEPTFHRGERAEPRRDDPISRCDTCHDETLAVDTAFMFRHVHARSRPARTHEDLARSCAVCHSHAAIRQAFGLPDTVASYLASFHGKAMLLGSEATAGCLDCHVGEMANAHMMLGHESPAAPTHETRLPDTCRSPACHPGAGARVSTAAVHLELTPSAPQSARRERNGDAATPAAAAGREIEYFIAALFVVLIVFTFGPSVVLQSLEMLQIVVGRHDPRHHQRERLAERVMAHPEGRRMLTRFTPHQRVQHWLLAICFTALVLTGFPIKFADRDWARWMCNLMGGLAGAREIHRWAGSVLILGAVYHLVYVLIHARREKRRTGHGWLRIIYDLPMVMQWKDIKQLFHLLGYLLFIRRTRPDLGRFSLKEKFEYFGVFWGCALLGVTGLLLWGHAWTSRYLTGRVLTVAALIHSFEAFLALLHVGVIHMIGVIFAPAVFPLSPAMLSGETPKEELAESHAGLLTNAAASVGVQSGPEANHG